jgi:hypothetical protein
VAFGLCAAGRAAAAEPVKVLLYDPDAAVPNIRVLRSAMQEYLAGRRADVRFAPFERLEDFRRAVAEERPQFAIVASWALRGEGARLGAKALATPTRAGKPTYEKRLVVTDRALGTRDLGGKTLATTRMGDDALLDQVMFKKIGLETRELKIVYVSKEIDALLALTFGQVKAALVTEATILAFAKSDPEGAAKLVTLAASREIPLPQLVYFPANCSDALVKEVLPLFLEMGQHPQGQRLLKLLRFDDWQPTRGGR